MKRYNFYPILLSFTAVIVCQSAGFAAPFSVGAGAKFTDKPYRGYDDEEKWAPIPLIFYEGTHLFVRGDRLGWNFLNSDQWELAVVGQYVPDGYDSSDSDFLRGMSDRDPSVMAGGHIRYHQPDKLGMSFTLAALTDISDESEGSLIRARVDYKVKSGDFTLEPFASIVWQDEDYNDYYYGVRPGEATAARPAYTADDDTNYLFGVAGTYRRGKSPWYFTSGVQYELLGDEIDDSTITNDDKVFSAFLGMGYTFGL